MKPSKVPFEFVRRDYDIDAHGCPLSLPPEFYAVPPEDMERFWKMTTILQLNPQIPVYVTSKSQEGRALGWLDISEEFSLIWIVALENREVWLVKTEEIRMLPNWTMDYAEETNPLD